MQIRSAIVLGALLALALVGSCGRRQNDRNGERTRSTSPAPTTELRDMPAVVHRFPLESDSWVLVDSTGTLWVPDVLPESFRSDGLAVLFSGRPAPDASPDRDEKPLELLHIARRGGRRS